MAYLMAVSDPSAPNLAKDSMVRREVSQTSGNPPSRDGCLLILIM